MVVFNLFRLSDEDIACLVRDGVEIGEVVPPPHTPCFKFNIGDKVHISAVEHGEVIGRAEYATAENSYFIRYVAGDKRCTESWWGESALRQ